MAHRDRVVLIILDGFGIGKDSAFNAIANAKMPFYKSLVAKAPHSELYTHGSAVGLPDGVMGNSEVGHMTMGAGRILYQDLVRITAAIHDGSFNKNPILIRTLEAGPKAGGSAHVMGLLSDGGVHSHIAHLEALLALALERKIPRVWVHAFLDGRDTAPGSGRGFLERILGHEAFRTDVAKIASISGRYYAMDRDNRWERIERAMQAMTGNAGSAAGQDPLEALDGLYASEPRGDEFIKPLLLDPDGAIGDGDSLVFFNFRSDRARQISRKFLEGPKPKLSAFCGMTEYDAKMALPAAFSPLPLTHLFGELLEENGLRQFRVAETEKYAHVTFFFNGGREAPFRGEDRILVPSPRGVATYDLKPEMSAPQIADEAVKRIDSGLYDFVLMNFANSDMVGHTGNYQAALKAMESIDECLEKVITSAHRAGDHVLVTADHGNAEEMCDQEGKPHTQHTLNPVPCIWLPAGSGAEPKSRKHKLRDGGLADLYPTLCDLLHLQTPAEVTGKSLLA